MKLVKTDYDTIDALIPNLRGQDAVVDLINRNHWETSIRLIDAAIAAEVPHFIPSAFGLDQTEEFLRSIPPIQGKIKMEDYLIAKAEEGAISFTAIETSMFFDWALKIGVLFPLAGGQARVFNDGNVKISTSLLDHIGLAVATALSKRDDDRVRNRVLLMQSTVVTQNQLIDYAREANPRKSWETISIDTEDMLKKSWDAFNKGERSPEVMRGFLAGGSYGKGLGLFKHVENDILGIQELREQDVKGLVAKYVK